MARRAGSRSSITSSRATPPSVASRIRSGVALTEVTADAAFPTAASSIRRDTT
jgi:hypothetical protein